MLGRLTWEALPPEVISRIFWCTDLQLVDRLRCEAVCQTWQAVLSTSPSEVQSPSKWDIHITLETSKQVYQTSQPSMRINGVNKRRFISGDAYRHFREWCKLKRHLLQRVRLTGEHPKAWQLQDLFRIFQAPILQRPPVLEVRLQCGLSFLLTCQELLRDTLVVLDLQPAANEGPQFVQAASLLSSLQALCKLSLTQCIVSSYDLRGCTQLTGLEISCAPWNPQNILLPIGDTVQLQHLVIKAKHNISSMLHNLQSATQLSHLDISFAHDLPLNCHDLGSLRSLTLRMCSMCTFDLSRYTQLTHVDIWGHHASTHEMKLPAGNTVMLQCLQLLGVPYDNYQLCNLRDATRLTCLEFRDMYPGRFDGYVWPDVMPALKVLIADCIPLAPPQELCGYTNLRLLDLRCFYMVPETNRKTLRRLPDCFVHMTKLKKLEILSIQDSLDYFPEVVLRLKHLCVVNLCDNRFERTGLSAEIMQFTEFSALTRLDFRLSLEPQRPQWRSTDFVTSSSTRQLAKLDSLIGLGVLDY